MARDFIIPGECLVKVKGFGALANPDDPSQPKLWELGLSKEGIRVTPHFYYKDIHVDDFGPDVPVEVLWNLALVEVRMTLIHFDLDVLDRCIAESMAGGTAGTFEPAGTPLGGGNEAFTTGCHYIGLNILSPVLNYPWRFLHTHLGETPFETPMGVRASEVDLLWRAIPYVPIVELTTTPAPTGTATTTPAPGWQFQELKSSGVVLWDHELDD